MTTYFPYKNPYVYFDGGAYSLSSLGNVVFHLARGLRELDIPAFTKPLPAGTFYPEFHEARHLAARSSPQVQRTAVDDFIYINPGWDYEEHLAIYARQSISIVAIDDFRAYSRRLAAKKYSAIASFSKFSAEALRGILKTDVIYFPLGVDTSKFFPIPRQEVKLPPLDFLYKNFQFPLSSFEGYVFLNVNFHQERKGTSELLTAYYNAFQGNPDVLLHIHGPQCCWADLNESRELRLFKSPKAPLVAWSTNLLSTPQVNQLFNFADCYVSPHHLEGFGFGPLQALACDRAVIATEAMGPMDYLTKDNAELLPCKIVQNQIKDFGKFPWALYKLGDLADMMRMLPRPRPAARSTALAWSWRKSAFAFSKLLDNPGEIFDNIAANHCTIVILCKGTPHLLASCLASVFKYPPMYPFSIIVVNDGASPAVSSTIAAHPELSPTELAIPKPRGIAHARNRALAKVESAYTLFLDCDVQAVEPHWLSMWIAAHQRARACISSVLQIHPNGNVNFDNAMVEGHRPNFNRPVTLAASASITIPYCQGSAMLVNTDIAQRYGFCEDYTYYYDDVDFCKYITAHGYRCRYLAATRMLHNPRELRLPDVTMSPRDIGQSTHDSYWKQGIIPAL